MIHLSKIFVPLLVVLSIIIAGWSVTSIEDDPCIIKKTQWNPERQTQEHLWKIEGHWYLVKETPNGEMEIVGLYSRYD